MIVTAFGYNRATMTWHSPAFLLLLLLAATTSGAPFHRRQRWSPFRFRRPSVALKPFQPQPARFAPPIQGFSNIFQRPSESTARSKWSSSQFPALRRTSWGSYPFGEARVEPLQTVGGRRHQGYPLVQRRNTPSPSLPQRRQARYQPAQLYPTKLGLASLLSGAELHGMVCVSASALEELIRATHRDTTDVTTGADGKVTTHRTVLAGKHGNTEHRTRVTSGPASTHVETVTNSTAALQRQSQSVKETADGLVQTSTGSAYYGGQQGAPTYSGVVSRSLTGTGSSVSRATASGYSGKQRVPTRSASESTSGRESPSSTPLSQDLVQPQKSAANADDKIVGSGPPSVGDALATEVAGKGEEDGMREAEEDGIREEEDDSMRVEEEDGMREGEGENDDRGEEMDNSEDVGDENEEDDAESQSREVEGSGT